MGRAAGDLRPRSAIVVPLEARGHRLGFIVLVACEQRPPFGEDDLAVAAEIARRSALQIDNARLYEAARALSASLERSDALKTAMLRGVSHEFRTPLTAIAAAGAALGHVEGDERDEMVTIVIEETERLERLVTNLLDLSRLEGGVLRPRLDECSLAELVAGARSAAARFLPPGDVVLDIDPSAPLVRADPILTERVLVNLLQNAKRHGAPPISVSARPADGAMEIVVADAGPGVPPDLRRSVFEPFTGTGAGGIGLGLALSRRLAEAEGAELSLLDDAPGASFCLRLPRADPPRMVGG
jgi:two-component system sensor histidine kinase KdpD